MISTAMRLNELLVEAGLATVDAGTAEKFSTYVSLILRWNERTNLTAIRDEEGILSRHIVESIALARFLPTAVETLLDFGSGAGLPGIPVALCRPEIRVTLAESQGKKAAFLQQAGRELGLSIVVHAGRAETLREQFDCVAMRAVDRMSEAVALAAGLVKSDGWLALMTTDGDWRGLTKSAGSGFHWAVTETLAGGDKRIVVMGRRHG